ncbi:MAG: thioredoxin domain-containing protein [Candidatus Magasanikbacteria bacterium]|nr:thioredoxin domain-containing protein [Candidatus Magasanikbacteria bacterium]
MEVAHRWLVSAVILSIILVCGGALYQLRDFFSTSPTSQKTATTSTDTGPLKIPTIKITDPQRGNEHAPLTIVYFADFGCESCAGTWPTIQALEADPQFKNKLRFVFKDFPAHQTIFPESLELHKAARCAASMGKFWEFQAAAFSHVEDVIINQPTLEKTITETGLDSTKVHACIESPGIQSMIDDNFTEGQRLGIDTTPLFFIGEERIDGTTTYQMLAGKIRTTLAHIEQGAQQTQ